MGGFSGRRCIAPVETAIGPPPEIHEQMQATSFRESAGFRDEVQAGPITVCICTCRRVDLLARLLDRLQEVARAGRTQAHIEILIVDNAPTGEVAALCEERGADLGWPVHYVEEPERGLCHARNRAVRTALEHKPEFIAFLDDDDLPRPDWLEALVARQHETNADIVCGRWELERADAQLDRYAHLYRSTQASKQDKAEPYGVPRGCATNNLMFRREVIEVMMAAGEHPFAPELQFTGCEDSDFLIRSVRRGFEVTRCERSVVLRGVEPERQDFHAQIGRALKNGRAKMMLCRRHGSASDRWRLTISAVLKGIGVVALLPGGLFSRKMGRKQVYRLAKLAGCLQCAVRREELFSSYYTRTS